MKGFENELYEYILKEIRTDNFMLSIKFSVESIGILETNKTEKVLQKSLSLKNSWINDIAFYSCRNLPNISDKVKSNLYDFFFNLDFNSLYRDYDDYKFSLSLSESFKSLRTLLKFRKIDFYVFFSTFFFSLLLLPMSTFTAILSSFLGFTFTKGKISNYRQTEIFVFFRTRIPLLFILSFLLISFLNISYIPDSYLFHYYGWYIALFYAFICIGYFHFFLNHKYKEIAYSALKNALSIIGIIVANVIGSGGLAYLIFKFPPETKFFKVLLDIWAWVSYIVIAVFILWLIYEAFYPIIQEFKVLLALIKDRKLYKSLLEQKSMTRKEIYVFYQNLKTENYRMKFVNFLEINSILATGDWPSKDILKLSTEKSKIRLMQLEEKWLGLNR